MAQHESANNLDPTLYCAYFGGPRDGFRTGDLPAFMSGKKLTGAVVRLPLSQPAQFSLRAVYVCSSEAQVDGFWRFEYFGLEGPNGEQLVAAEAETSQQAGPEHADPAPPARSTTQSPLSAPTTGAHP